VLQITSRRVKVTTAVNNMHYERKIIRALKESMICHTTHQLAIARQTFPAKF